MGISVKCSECGKPLDLVRCMIDGDGYMEIEVSFCEYCGDEKASQAYDEGKEDAQ